MHEMGSMEGNNVYEVDLYVTGCFFVDRLVKINK